MGKAFKMAAVFAMIFLWIGGAAFAGDYYVPWWQLQKRTYENGNSFNRMAFCVVDGGGTYVSTNVVKSVSLEGPGGPITLPSLHFSTYETLYGSFLPDSGQWYYDPAFGFANYCRVNFGGELEPGFYTLTVVDTDDVTIFEGSQYFNGIVDLPQISSKTFRGYEDAAGNVIWHWDLPSDTDFWQSYPDCSIRSWVSVYNGSAYIGDIYVRVPLTATMMLVPSSVMDLARQKGDNFEVGLHVRTNDNNNRSYSHNVPFSSLRKDLRRAVVIPLN